MLRSHRQSDRFSKRLILHNEPKGVRRGALRPLTRNRTISHGFVSILAESEMKMDIAIGVVKVKEATIECETGGDQA